MLSFTIGASSISVFLDGVFHLIDASHANYERLRRELSRPKDERDIDTVRGFVSLKAMIQHLTFGRVSISETEVLFEGTKIGTFLANRMLEMAQNGADIEPYARFMDNVFDNPATYTRDELYQWMRKANLPITPDGHFLAFKKVRADYMDCHSGKCDNRPGNTLAMPRGECDPVRTNVCSSGFHFASPDYFRTFGGERMIVVKVNPRDVTAIPVDYNFTKGRTCRYVVIGEIFGDHGYDPFWRKGIVDLLNDAVPDWITATPPNGVVIGAQGDPSDEVIEAEQAVAALEDAQTDSGKTSGAPTISDDSLDVATQVPTVTVSASEIGCGSNANQRAIALVVSSDEDLSALSAEKRLEIANEAIIEKRCEIEGNERQNAFAASMGLIPCTLTLRQMVDEADMMRQADRLGAENWPEVSKLEAGDFVLRTDAAQVRDNGVYVVVDDKRGALAQIDADAAASEQQVFSTADGREFTPAVIRQAMADASIRGAARNLGIGDSTLRGWLKRMGN